MGNGAKCPAPLLKDKTMSNPNTCIDLSCFDEIIGLSQTVCECYPDNNYDASKSCMWLDEAEGLTLRRIEALEDCATDDNLFMLMDRARTKAIQRFVGETQAKMAERYDPARTIYTGYIGKNAKKYVRNINNTYAGMRLRTGQITGGYLKITAINTLFEATGTVSLDIYNSLNEKLYSISLDTQAGVMKRNVLATPISLPLWDGRCDELDYVFVYTYDSLNKPYDTKVSCCGKVYNFSCLHPYYRQRSNKLDGWAMYVMAGALAVNSLDFSDLSCTTSDYTNGLQLEVNAYCDTTKQFCFEQQDINNPMYLMTAKAIMHAAAQYLCIALITSDKINRYTMIDREALENVRLMHESKYQAAIEHLVVTADLRNTDCYICKNKFNIQRAVL
jgi:hypothetical protein